MGPNLRIHNGVLQIMPTVLNDDGALPAPIMEYIAVVYTSRLDMAAPTWDFDGSSNVPVNITNNTSRLVSQTFIRAN